MKFSLYSEVQHWPGKTPTRLYQEVIEQVVHADRLGYDAYAVIEHFFFPKFSISANPFALWATCAERTKRIRFRTLGHVLPYHNPTILASQIAHGGRALRRPLRVRRAAWPRVDSRRRPASRSSRARDRYEESLEILFKALEKERFSYDGTVLHDRRLAHRPASDEHASASSSAGRATGRTSSQPSAAGRSSCRRSCPYAALKDQLDLYRAKCAEHGTTPDIVWIHACYLDDDRDTARREAEQGMRNFLAGQRLAADGRGQAATRRGHGGRRLRLLPGRHPRGACRRRRTTR